MMRIALISKEHGDLNGIGIMSEIIFKIFRDFGHTVDVISIDPPKGAYDLVFVNDLCNCGICTDPNAILWVQCNKRFFNPDFGNRITAVEAQKMVDYYKRHIWASEDSMISWGYSGGMIIPNTIRDDEVRKTQMMYESRIRDKWNLHKFPDKSVVIVGWLSSFCDEQLAKRIKSQEGFRFLGERMNSLQIISIADNLLLPSREEAHCLVELEAMALGIPIIKNFETMERERNPYWGVYDNEIFYTRLAKMLKEI